MIKFGLDKIFEKKMIQTDDMNEVEFILNNLTQFINKADNLKIFLENLNQNILEQTLLKALY